jgi:hypothetical protein
MTFLFVDGIYISSFLLFSVFIKYLIIEIYHRFLINNLVVVFVLHSLTEINKRSKVSVSV